MRVEVTIWTKDAKDRAEAEDLLILGLARAGYSPYLTEFGVAYTCEEGESVHEIKEAGE